jgi:hypothetical protein
MPKERNKADSYREKAYEGDTKATFQGYQPAIDYCKEHGYKWY